MPVLFSGNTGRVISLPDRVAVGAISMGSLSGSSGLLDLGSRAFSDFWEGRVSYDIHRSIITRIGVSHAGNYQFLHTLGNSVYIYTFGDRMGQVTVHGLSFAKQCAESSNVLSNLASGTGTLVGGALGQNIVSGLGGLAPGGQNVASGIANVGGSLSGTTGQLLTSAGNFIGSAISSRKDSHGFEDLYEWYERNRIAARKEPVTVTVGIRTAFSGFITGLNADVQDAEHRMISWQMTIATLPQTKSLGLLTNIY